MRLYRNASLVGVGLALLAAGVYLTAADGPPIEKQRENANKLFQEGNFNDAYKIIRPVALDKGNPVPAGDLTLGLQSLARLGRIDEIDEFREAVILAHEKNWSLLFTAARSYLDYEHHGYIVAGEFSRGYKRGGGRFVNASARDRVRAMQLLVQAMPLATADKDRGAVSEFFFTLANAVRHGIGGQSAWKLQDLTDLSQLPDYEEGNQWRGRRWGRGWEGGWDGGWGEPERGAPVDERGEPLYYALPKSWENAANDGERWRWCLAQAVEYNTSRAGEVDMIWADFCRSQYGVQTLSFTPRDTGKDGTFSLHTLGDHETIARLAIGVKRFALPKEHNHLEIWKRVRERGKDGHAYQARLNLAQEFEDRRQYPKAGDAWRDVIANHGKGGNNEHQHRLDQIVGNWGIIEPFQTQPAITKATFDLRFRNAKKVTFTAHAIKVEKLLTDVQDYLKTNPRNLDWQQTNIGDLGYRLVHRNQKEYLGEQVATWSLDLKPRDNHVDERISVETPLTNAGAYFIEAKMEGGNTTRAIAWVADTVIVKKMLDGKAMHFVADAVTGKPIDKANLEFFGWRQDYVPQPGGGGFYKITTSAMAQNTDADGMVYTSNADQPSNFNWLAIARKKGDGANGLDRFAFLGFSNVWYGRQYDPQYHATRVFGITDRPVYRPDHKVQFKAWVRHAKYDQPNVSDFAGRTYPVAIYNPKGEKIFEQSIQADEYAGLLGEYTLPKDATLGVYHIQVGVHGHVSSFRVEEYKKPEFEVKVEAPKEPTKLGDKIEAVVQARYYFGAPVTKGNAKIKVTRTAHTNNWYAPGRWDWFYGKGYWWFAPDYVWYPGFAEWGCYRPYPVWYGPWNPEPPEVVMDTEVPVGPDGEIKVVIDTAVAKELYGDTDHKYSITAEVVDESRRTIVGTGDVIAARKPFSVFAWVDRGHYRSGDTIKASFQAYTPDQKPVKGTGKLSLMAVSYKDGQPEEKEVESWKLDTNDQGQANLQIKAAKAGQFRLVYQVTDAKDNTIEGGYVFVVRGEAFTGKEYRFNDIEIITDKREYADGDKAKLLINTNQQDGTVLLFARPAGVYLQPKMLRIKGKSTEETLDITKKDMPNIFVEVLTVHGGRVHTEVREIVVPPEQRILNVEVLPDSLEYKPGQKAKVKVRLTDFDGQPFVGSTVMSVYDRAVEYISGGSNVPEIKEFFWKWRRSHHPNTEHSLARGSSHIGKQNERTLSFIGRFGASVVEEMLESRKPGENRLKRLRKDDGAEREMAGRGAGGGFGRPGGPAPAMGAAPGAPMADGAPADAMSDKQSEGKGQGAGPVADPAAPQVEPSIRQNFADTAYWNGALTTDKDGFAEVTFDMPEQTTGWKVRVWGMGHGTRVGQGEVEVTTRKDLLLRMQAPRFFVQKDEVVLSANVHNYLKSEKLTTVTLETEGGTLMLDGPATQKIKLAAGGEQRVDWRVKVVGEGPTIVRMKATTDEESDAMQMSFLSHVHGMLKMESFTGVIRPDQTSGKIELNVPAERRVPQSRLEVRFSPSLAGAMVDALPYLIEYPYGCTEQTLNRFLPSVITQKVLLNMKLDLEDIQKKRTNLNAAEIGDAKERAKGWKRYNREPVFDKDELKRVVQAGVNALTNMQCSDGGWGWFSGFGERSYPHTTAVVVHGLQVAQQNDVALVPGMLDRGIAWLKIYQEEQVRQIQNAQGKVKPWKDKADALDALIYMVLMDGGVANPAMREFLYRDRIELPVYAKALFGLALHKEGGQADKLAMILKNIEQFVVEDNENQTAYLRLPAGNAWWYWHGSEIEANAWYLKLLSKTMPKDKKASGLVKYLLNNRKHATYWNSTRDTALCIEAMADYMKASGEDKPDMTVEVLVDGKVMKEVKIDSTNLFSFDNVVVLEGEAVTDGKHTVEVRKKGTGAVYFNAYLTNFTLEDFITKAGLEIKVNRKFYKLTRADKTVKTPGTTGRLTDKRVEKYVRTEIANLSTLKSGDLVEVELEIDSKNDYEYILFEDMKASGFEPMLVRSGYNPNDLGAYMELRDDRVCFFVRALARGKHSVSYRLRAEIPGRFSALPARASAMYAPELKGNSDEMKVIIED
jgi:uncharacterized protein YfaS (alpha-2-macroglobulin family)